MKKQLLMVGVAILALSAAPAFAAGHCTPADSLVDVGGGKNCFGNPIGYTAPFRGAQDGVEPAAAAPADPEPSEPSEPDPGDDNGEGENGEGENGEGENGEGENGENGENGDHDNGENGKK